jgi:hypothetical protein
MDNLPVPLAEIARLGRGAPFWIRLHARVQRPERQAGADGDAGFGLGSLIEVLSRRRQDETADRSLEAGPFHLQGP